MYANKLAVEHMENAACEPKRETLAEKSKRLGYLLEEAKIIMSDIGVNMFGDAPIEENRPGTECMEHEMCLNVIAMENLLSGLLTLKERLY